VVELVMGKLAGLAQKLFPSIATCVRLQPIRISIGRGLYVSIIVAVRKNNEIAIGADTLAKSGNERLTTEYKRNSRKIIDFRETYIAAVGTSAHMDVLQSVLSRYEKKLSFNSRSEIFESFRVLHPILKDEYFLNPHEKDPGDYESSQMNLLIANPFGIFAVFSWRGVSEYERYYALGSGDQYAMGAMHATYENRASKQIAEAGLLAACQFDDGCAAPIEVCLIRAATLTARASSR
jgi:ATP-dependent protease HslVU (ClpYQ) peptidase subunit